MPITLNTASGRDCNGNFPVFLVGAVNIAQSSNVILILNSDTAAFDPATVNLTMTRSGVPQSVVSAGVIQPTWNGFGSGVAFGMAGPGVWFVNLTAVPTIIWGVYETVTVHLTASDMLGSTYDNTFTFETGDQVPPFVTNVTPLNGAIDVPVTSSITLQANDLNSNIDLTATTVGLTINVFTSEVAYDGSLGGFQAGYSGSVTPNGNGYDFVVQRTAPFPEGATVDVAVDTADDADSTPRNQFTGTVTEFTTVSDDPYIINLDPPDGAVDVPVTAVVMMTITDDSSNIDLASVTIFWFLGADPTPDIPVEFGVLQPPYDNGGSAIIANGRGFDFILHRDSVFPGNTTMTGEILAADEAFNQIDVPYSFTTGASGSVPVPVDTNFYLLIQRR